MALSLSDVEQLQLYDYDQNRLEKVRLLNFLPIIENNYNLLLPLFCYYNIKCKLRPVLKLLDNNKVAPTDPNTGASWNIVSYPHQASINRLLPRQAQLSSKLVRCLVD